MTNENPVIDLSSHVRLDLEDDGLRVGLVPVDNGIAILLTLTTDLGKFVVGLNAGHIQMLYAVIRNIANFTPQQYKAAYDQLVTLSQGDEQ